MSRYKDDMQVYMGRFGTDLEAKTKHMDAQHAEATRLISQVTERYERSARQVSALEVKMSE